MTLMDLKVFREIKTQKLRSLLIIGIVAVTVGMVSGMRVSYPMILENYNENLKERSVADGRFTFSSPIAETNVTDILADSTFLQNNNIQDLEGRIMFLSEVSYQEEKFPAIIIGIDYPNTLNELALDQIGSGVDRNSNFLAENHSIIVESRFGSDLIGQSIPLESNLSIAFQGVSDNFTIKAYAYDADNVYVVDPTSQITLMGQMAIVWMDLSLMQNYLFGGLPLINQILFTVDERLDKPMILKSAEALGLQFNLNGIDVSASEFTIFDETIDRKFFEADVGSIDEVGTIFGIIGLIVCAVAIFNALTRIVQSQRRNIGLFLAMGAKKSKIVTHYVKITMVLASIGVILGIPLGYLLAYGMVQLVGGFFGLTLYFLPIAWAEFGMIALITLVTSMGISALTAYPITRATPREAMAATFNRINATKNTFAEKLFTWIPGFRSIHMLVPIREIFMRKKKSLVSALALTTSMIILINSVAMTTNFYTSFTSYYDTYNTADLQVRFESPIPMADMNAFLENHSADISYSEYFLIIPSLLVVNGDLKSYMQIEIYQENSTLRTVNVIKGNATEKADWSPEHLVLGNAIAGKYNIQVGDEIEIGLLSNYSVEVDGLVGELIDYSAFWTLEAFQQGNTSLYFGLPNYTINGVLITLGDNADLIQLRDEFDAQFAVSQWTESEQARKSIFNLIQTLMSILLLFVLIGIAISILFSFNTMYMAFLSREQDFLSLKAQGTDPKYIRRMIFWENTIISLFSLIMTVPIGYLFYWWSMDYMVGDRFYIPLSIPWYVWPMVFLLNVVSIRLSTRKLMKKIDKLVLADELRNRVVQ